MIKITKRLVKKEYLEYVVECDKCQKIIIGSTESQIKFLLMVHQSGSKCQKKYYKGGTQKK